MPGRKQNPYESRTSLSERARTCSNCAVSRSRRSRPRSGTARCRSTCMRAHHFLSCKFTTTNARKHNEPGVDSVYDASVEGEGRVNAGQIAGAIALAVIGLLLIIVSATARDGIGEQTTFGDHLSKAGIFLGAAFMLPLLLMLLTGIILGF